MMPGFVQVDASTFYLVHWPKIKNEVEAVESNWPHAVKGVRPKIDLPIVIKWGSKDKESGKTSILAISKSDESGDVHWVNEILIEGI